MNRGLFCTKGRGFRPAHFPAMTATLLSPLASEPSAEAINPISVDSTPPGFPGKSRIPPSGLTRIGVFYDGSFYLKMSQYYKYHERRRRGLSFPGLHSYLRHKIAAMEGRPTSLCQVVEAHFFRGRFSLTTALARGSLESDRYVDQLLMGAGIHPHYYPMNERADPPEEKGVDVWLSLEAYDVALHRGLDLVVLVTTDQDFVPLIRKLTAAGTRVMLLTADLRWQHHGVEKVVCASRALLSEATYPVVLTAEIAAAADHDPQIEGLFEK